MANPSHPERIRDSWQQRRLAGAPAKAWLVVRRTVATLIALGLIGFCGYLLFTLIWAPKTYFIHLSAGTYSPLSGQPVLFTRGDSEAFKDLENAFASFEVADALENPLTKRLVEEKLSDLAGAGLRKKDTLIVYLTAHGIVRGNEAAILCERTDRSGGEDPLPVSSILDGLARSSAGTKLLILDAGREGGGSPAGPAVNTFPKILEDEIKDRQDPTLWVLSANAALERSHVSHALRKSVLAYIVAKGLGGLADQNRDQIVRLDEFYNYVQAGVSAWVDQSSAGNETQTPILLNCEPARLATNSPALVSVKQLPKVESLNIREDLEQSADAGLSEKAAGLQAMAPARLQETADRLAATKQSSGTQATQPAGEGETEENTSASPPAAPGALEAGVNYGGLAQQQLTKSWQESAKLEAVSSWSNPSYAAPPLWRALVNHLLWCEQFIQANVPPNDATAWRPVLNELTGFERALSAFSKPETQGSPGGNVVERIHGFLPQVPLKATPSDYISVALSQLISSRLANGPMPKELGEFAAAYDALITKETSTAADLAALVEKYKEFVEPGKFYELRLLEIARDPNVSWDLSRLALGTRRLGEHVAASLLCGQGWSRNTIEDADRLRWEGERAIVDQTSTNWPELAETRLTAARKKYEQAAQELSIVRETLEDRNQLLRQVPQYLRWAHLSGRDRSGTVRRTEALKDLLNLLTSIDESLSNPSGESVARLEQLHGQLIEARAALQPELEPAKSPWRMANLLSTSLPSVDRRQQLQVDMVKIEEAQLPDFNFSVSAPATAAASELSDQRWNEVREQLELEVAFARLAGCEGELVDRLEQTLADTKRDGWQRISDARETLRAMYAALPASIQSIPDASDLRNAQTRPERLHSLYAAQRHWLLLDSQHQDDISPETNNLISALSNASWYDLLSWQSNRFERSAVDAPSREEKYLIAAATQFRRLASDIPQQPQLDPPALPQLAIEATQRVSLVTDDEVRLPITIQSSSKVDMPVWIVAQYDGKKLEVEGSGVLSQDTLRADAAEASRNRPASEGVAYPYLPEDLSLEGVPLAAEDSMDVTLRVKRREGEQGSTGSTKLILKAISDNTYVRQELEVELLPPELLQLTVDGDSDFWTATNDGVVLHPLPNRVRDFAFNLVNREPVAKKLEVSFEVPSRAPDSVTRVKLPPGALRPETAEKLLAPFKPYATLGRPFPIDLPASSTPVRVKLNPTGDQKVDPLANLLASDPATANEFTGIPLRHGLLIIIRNVATGEQTIRRLEIAPQRPRRYLDAVASYDANTDRLQIDVTAANENAIPPEGVRVKLRVVEGVSAQQEKRLEAVLTPPGYSAQLYAFLQSNAPREVTAVVDTDDYPRAFTFNISRGLTDTGIQPADDVIGIRITSPVPGSVYRAPVDTVAATVEVDAPEGSFGYAGGTSYVEVGVDIDRDGELQDEQALVLRSDRQIEVAAKALSPAGALRLDTRVGDFRLNLPSTGLSELSANLRGHVVSRRDERWSQAVEVGFDGAGPKLSVALDPGRKVEQGADLKVRATTARDLSGVQSVEAVFDSIEQAAAGDAAEAKSPWIAAMPEGPVVWVATLKTDNMPTGRQTVLIRATDKVGNKSEVYREEVEIIPKRPVRKPTPAQEQSQLANTVTGSVMYYDERIPDARVVLESAAGAQIEPVTSGSNGGFTFPRVPPGAYTLKSEKVIRNRNRKGVLQITVPPRPKTLPAVTLNLGQSS